MAGKKGMKGPGLGGRRKGAGRPRFQPTDLQRKQVAKFAAFGMSLENIAQLVADKPIDVETLKRAFKDELNLASEKADMAVIESLWIQSVGADAIYDQQTGRLLREEQKRVPSAGIYWTKARRGWRDGDPRGGGRNDDEGGGGDDSTTTIVIVGGLPDPPKEAPPAIDAPKAETSDDKSNDKT